MIQQLPARAQTVAEYQSTRSGSGPAVTVDELRRALRISRQAVEKAAKKGRFGESIIASGHAYLLERFARHDDRDRIAALRAAVRDKEAVAVLKETIDVKRSERSQIDLSDHERTVAWSRSRLLLWIARCQRDQGVNRKQATMRAEAHAEISGECEFRVLLRMGKGGCSAINIENINEWFAKWKPYRRHEFDDYQWHTLADGRAEGARTRALTVETRHGDKRYWHRIALLYESLNGRALSTCWSDAVRIGREKGWGEAPTFYEVRHWYRTKVDRAAVVARRKGEKFIYNELDLTCRRDWNIPFGSLWCSDHHYMNVFVRVPVSHAPGHWRAVRPWITQFLDVPTMHEVASIIRPRDPDGDVILQAWQLAVERLGWSAAAVYFDNGKDYRSIGGKRQRISPLDQAKISTTAQILGVRATFALPFNARAKPCEMDFGLHVSKFERSMETFCGHNWETFKIVHPTLCREKLKTFGGDNEFSGFLVNPDLVPRFDEFCAEYYRWRSEERETWESDGIMLDGKSPEQAWALGLAACDRPCIDADTRFLAFLRAFAKPQAVSRGCVVWFKRGESKRQHIRYHSRALEPFLISGEQVLVKVNTADLSHAYVFHWLENRGWKLIDCGGPHGGCPSVADIPFGTGLDQVRDIQAANRRRAKDIRTGIDAGDQEQAIRELRQRGMSSATDTEILLTEGPRAVTLRATETRRRDTALREAFAEVNEEDEQRYLQGAGAQEAKNA